MRPTEHARNAALMLLGFGLLALACLYAQAGVYPMAAGTSTGAWICAEAASHLRHIARERRQLAADLERLARPQADPQALADEIALSWAELEQSCCPASWCSRGLEHDADCRPNDLQEKSS
ncbi:hypothetical protein E3E14_25205 [Streptomyces sp. ICN441]|uniref:hypothetical protein n=1 Tax=Streptomyces sp. ICN441 TaxID=2558286 RepID=UPI001069D9AC|nr:hypothetical protein [Streptomyces sp. ICN441]TFE42485.1 hypothetical protein E3E14_25205 [Streptomyces sp. ICN441]